MCVRKSGREKKRARGIEREKIKALRQCESARERERERVLSPFDFEVS